MLASARAAAPGRRAPFVHIKVEDSTSGEDTDAEGGGGEGEEAATGGKGDGEGEKEKGAAEEEAAEEEGTEQRDHESGTSIKGGSETDRPQRLAPGAHSEPGPPRRAPGRYADNAVQDNDVGEEEGDVSELVIRGGAGSSQFMGVSWHKSNNKWQAKCKGKALGLHTTEEAAARAYSKYLEDGSVPGPPAGSSQFKGVTWSKSKHKWRAVCTGMHLGYHAMEQDAARACSKYLEDDIDTVEHREASTSQFKGVHWNKQASKWKAQYKGKHLGCHATEEDAACAYSKYLNDGIDPVERRDSTSSQFKGVY